MFTSDGREIGGGNEVAGATEAIVNKFSLGFVLFCVRHRREFEPPTPRKV